MSDEFDTEDFLHWLGDYKGQITRPLMDEQWPNFPWRNIGIVTVYLDDDGNTVYSKRDLANAAKKEK